MVYKFSPRLLPTITVLLLLPLLISLGFWQLQRAEFKRTLLASYDTNRNAKPLALKDAPNQPENFIPIHIQGHYDNQHSILVDNVIIDHQVGYYVVTPILLSREFHRQAILINRGWIPRGASREHLPKVSAVIEPVALEGFVSYPNPKPFLLNDADEKQPISWPLRVPALKLKQLENKLGYSLYPYLLKLKAEEKTGFKRNWQPTLRMGPQKHEAYAFQWFALALTLLVLYLMVSFRRTNETANKK